MYSLFLYWYDTYKKPILLVSGNHEAYTLPYGIAPRVEKTKTFIENAKNAVVNKTVPEIITESAAARAQEWNRRKENGNGSNGTRANEGIPADHNLTITEAILIYGPDYNRVTMSGGAKGPYKNFKPVNFDWFHTVFTPLNDYFLLFKEQCFIGLGWGMDEKFAASGLDGHVDDVFWGGFLPRATESLDDNQKTLLQRALRAKAPCTVLFSHFTVANYAGSKALGTDGEISYSGIRAKWGDADHGSFEGNRAEIYTPLTDAQIDLTLSGHSHRSGLYQPNGIRESPGRQSLTLKSRLPQAPSPGKSLRPYQSVESRKAKIVVSASGGPIPKQNYRGELFSWGLERPSGTLVRFNGSEARVTLVESKNDQAQPRFAVAWDYADIIGNEKHGCGVFRTFESDASGMNFTIQINPDLRLPDVDLIASIDLFHYASVPPKRVPMTVRYVGGGRYKAAVSGLDNYFEERLLKAPDPIFLSMVFEKNLGTHTGFQQYDFSSPWNIQIEVVQKATAIKEEYSKLIQQQAIYDHIGTLSSMLIKEMAEKMKSAKGMVVRRHSIYGEVPRMEWRIQKFNNEFAFSLLK